MSSPYADQTPPPGCPAHRLYGPDAEADPMGLYEKLRAEHGAVAPVLVHGDLPAWLVLGHRENLDVARTPSRFSRDPRRWRDMQEGNVPADHPLTPMTAWQPVCHFVDGVEHDRLRGAITESLERFDRRGVRRYVKRFADQLIDAFVQSGRADLVAAFAEPLPMLVMTQLVGAPESYGPRLVEAARDMIRGTETAVVSSEYVTVTLRELVARKREVPGRDFTTWLLEHPTALGDEEIVEHLRLVLIAAFETTANLIANTLRMVLTDSRFRANLSGGHMTLPDALEQVLWDEPPLMTVLGRWATGDTEIAGVRIEAGDMLLLGLGAGNLDPEIRPDATLPVHGNRSHLAFSSGPHECPGQDIGRAIADTGIDTLLTRLPDLELAVPEGELEWNASLMSRHLVALPVRFTPRGSTVTGSTPVPVPVTVPRPRTEARPATAPAGSPAVPPAGGRPTGRTSLWTRLLGRS
ncbi:cytochrome P450 [Streptomyces goshikiensis]|uniref:cytochrome P450 n=1 Tax=Streptomyces goshikiensis TaxID=1942 RepID=UPI0033295493